MFRPGTLPDVFRLIEKNAVALKGVQRRTTAAAGLTPAQFVVMGALWDRDLRPLKELAIVALCTPATVTGIVDVLERKGLVTRESNPADRRSLLVQLTEAGRAMESAVPTTQEMFGGCCSGLSSEEVATLAELLGRLNESLETWG